VLSPSTHPGEILLVGSSKAGIETRCVLPAGGIDPEDISAAEAARREAREEAGVEGKVIGLPGLRPLALITDTKKMAKTQVFLLLVSREIPLSTKVEEEEDNDVIKNEEKKTVIGSANDDIEEDVEEVKIRGRVWVSLSKAASMFGGKESQILCLSGALDALKRVVKEECSDDEELLQRGLDALLKNKDGEKREDLHTIQLSTST